MISVTTRRIEAGEASRTNPRPLTPLLGFVVPVRVTNVANSMKYVSVLIANEPLKRQPASFASLV
jgi:hypothetical protein